jgi:hypothetical protein
MRRTIPAFALLLIPVACQGPRPQETNAAKGREALTSALETWKKGGTPADLKNGSPAIVVSDPDWVGGCRLLKYDVDPTDRRAGVDLRLTATLTLKGPTGKTVQKTAGYVISTGSKLTVLRDDPDS